MKITIDTRADSAEEMKHVINILNRLIEGHNSEDTVAVPVTDGIFGMFQNSHETSEEIPGQKEETSQSSLEVSEVDSLFADNTVEEVEIGEQKVVEGVKPFNSGDDIRVVPY